MIWETLLNGAFFLVGYTILAGTSSTRAQPLGLLLPAYLVGLVAYTLLALVTGALGLLYPLVCLALMVIVALFILVRNRETHRQSILWCVAGFLLVLAMSAWLEQNLWAVASYDSFRLLLVGQPLSLEQGFTRDNIGYFASWGVLIPMLHGIAPSIGSDYLNTLQPMISLVGTLVLAHGLYRTAREFTSLFPSVAITIGALVAICSTYFLAFQTIYLHNNLASAIYLTLGILGLLNWKSSSSWSAAAICFCGFLGFSLLRVETPLFCAVFLACLYPIGPSDQQGYRYFLRLLTGTIGVWYGYLALMMGSGTDILTPGRVLIIISPLIIWTMAVELNARVSNPLLKWSLDHAPYLILGFALVALGIGFAIDPDHLSITVDNMSINAFTHGRWAFFWQLTWLLTFVCLLISSTPQSRILLIACIVFLLGLVMLSLGREPYRVGWGDSANRMFTHIAGILWLGIVHSIASFLGQDAKPGLPTKRVIFICGLVLLCTNPWHGWFLSPLNRFHDAEVVTEPTWKLNNKLEIATQLKPSKGYAAANSSGKAQIKLKLKNRVKQGYIEVVDYHRDLAMTSFQWSARATEGTYVILASVDKDAGMNRNVFYLSETHYCVYFELPKATKYIRFDFERGRDQNRLLVKYLALFSTNKVQRIRDLLWNPRNPKGCPSTPPNSLQSAVSA